MGKGPLDHPRLRAIEHKLDGGELDEAKHMLAQLGDVAFFRTATSYLATRLLYLRGRLQAEDVVERLRELLSSVEYFPQAAQMLRAAEAGQLRRDRSFKSQESGVPSGAPTGSAPEIESKLSTLSVEPEQLELGDPPDATAHSNPPLGSSPPAAHASPKGDALQPRAQDKAAPPLESFEALEAPEESFRAMPPRRAPSVGQIPRAARVPQFSAPPDPTPSYVPPQHRPTPEGTGRYTAKKGEEHVSVSSPAPAGLKVNPHTAVTEPASPLSDSRGQRAPRIRSGLPPAEPVQGPSNLFEIAALADAGQPREALAALSRLEGEGGAEHALLEARLLHLLERTDAAAERVRRLARAPLLDPELRASAARLLLELGQPESALEQARIAEQDDPEPAMIRLTLAWSALSVSARSHDVALLELAERALSQLDAENLASPALLPALEAELLRQQGDLDGARALAQRALGEDRDLDEARAVLQRLDEP